MKPDKDDDKKRKKENIILVSVFLILVIGAGAVFYGSQPSSVIDNDGLAKCLTEQGFRMFGSESCGACQSQKRMFGDSFRHIDYIDCGYREQECIENEIRAYPTWKLDDNKMVGVMSLEKLSQVSGCGQE